MMVALVMAACGDDDEPVPSGQGGKGGTAGKGGTSGTAGKGGSGGAMGSAGKGGSAGTVGTAGKAGTDGGDGSAGIDGGGGSAGTDGGQTKQQRGEYLVKHVGACPDCHTPRKADGSPDLAKFLAGNPTFADIAPNDDAGGIGMVPSRNITPDTTTGIGSWTDAEIKAAFLDGMSKRTGAPLFPIMPYYVLHNMTPEDADAIVAYLRSVPPINNAIAPRQDLGFPFTQAAQPVPVASIPNTTLATTDANYARAQNGKYLAGHIGICMECHTKDVQAAVPIDTTRLFQGNREFQAVEFGLPPGFPAIIFSRNLTPTANGIQGWTAQAVADAIRLGVDKDGVPICPPMPAGPGQAFGGITPSDALDIGHYLTTLPPVDNGVIPNCTPPRPDASTD